MCLVSHKCETGALFHVFVILGAAVPKFIHSPFFYPSCAISFAGIVALIYYCIGCNGGASIACWLQWWIGFFFGWTLHCPNLKGIHDF